MARAAPALARHQAWRSVYGIVARFVRNEKLRQALSFHTLLVGVNPCTTSAIHALAHKRERDGGVWCAQGGTNRLVAGLVTQFERLGGTLRLGDPVTGIATLGDRATGVTTASGWTAEADAVASNADVMHSYRDLLSDSRRPRRLRARPARTTSSPPWFTVHSGHKGAW